jgi:hypothetical protein
MLEPPHYRPKVTSSLLNRSYRLTVYSFIALLQILLVALEKKSAFPSPIMPQSLSEAARMLSMLVRSP